MAASPAAAVFDINIMMPIAIIARAIDDINRDGLAVAALLLGFGGRWTIGFL